MIDEFLLDLKSVYSLVINKKISNINEFKSKWDVGNSIGEVYQTLCKKSLRWT